MCTRCYSIHVCVASSHLSFCHVYLFHFVGWFCFMFHVSFCKNIFLIFVSHFIHYFRDAIGKRKYSVAVRIASLFFLDNFQNVHRVLFTAYTISSMYGVCWYFYLIGFTTLLSLLKWMLGAGWGIKRSTRRQTQIAFWDMYRRKDKRTPALTSNLLSNFLFFCFSLCMYDKHCHCAYLCVHCTSMAMSCVCMWWIQYDLIASKCAVIIPFLFRFNDVVYYLFGWMEKCNDCVA